MWILNWNSDYWSIIKFKFMVGNLEYTHRDINLHRHYQYHNMVSLIWQKMKMYNFFRILIYIDMLISHNLGTHSLVTMRGFKIAAKRKLRYS